MFVHNGIELDYNFRETIENMKAFADQVVILDVGSEDGTDIVCNQYADYKTKVICYDRLAWDEQKGKEKLAYFQNQAKKHLNTDYYMVVQADEVVHEASFGAIREAINWGLPAYMVTRHNLWFDPWHQLNVEQGRKPCSTEVIRLALTKFDSIGDGESFDCPQVCFDFLDAIRIYHMGFVRDLDVMKKKVIYIQEQVFQTPHDARLDEDVAFNPHRYFNIYDDAESISEPLPKHIQKWANERYPLGPTKK